MSGKIFLSPDAPIVCPKCSNGFPLQLGITQQTIEKYESEYEAAITAERKVLEERLAKEAERKASKTFTDQIAQLTEQLGQSKHAAAEAKSLITKAQIDAKNKALAEFELEKKSFAEEIAEKDTKLKIFREQELKLRTEKRELEEARQNMQLEMVRKIEEERQKIQQQIVDTESEKFKLKEAELRKQIDDARKANEDLRRKLDQGSQQLQGEVLELALEGILTDAFRHDRIDEVKKGQRGADVLQTVCTPSGQICGKIVWEAKRAEYWSDKWLTKLKDDQLDVRADIAVLVTTAMPKGTTEPFCLIGDIWLTSPHVIRPVGEMLRIMLLEANRLKLINTGRNEKMDLLYKYLSSAQFAQKVRTVLESLESMRNDLEAEKRAMQRIWTKRQAQIERVTGSMVGVVGELQGIAHDSLPQLESIEQLALPTGDIEELVDSRP